MTFTPYSNTGPFNNNLAPALAATFFNNVETFLDSITQSIVNDSHVTTDGNGHVTVVQIKLTTGSITRISVFTGTANSSGTLQAHGLGVKPDFCMFQETSGASDVNNFTWDINASDATNVKVWSGNASSRAYVALAVKL